MMGKKMNEQMSKWTKNTDEAKKPVSIKFNSKKTVKTSAPAQEEGQVPDPNLEPQQIQPPPQHPPPQNPPPQSTEITKEERSTPKKVEPEPIVEEDPLQKSNTITQNGIEISVGNVCLLCKRKFPNELALQKHIELSDLHRDNLEIAKLKQIQRKKDFQNDISEKRAAREAYFSTIESASSEPKSDLNENNKGHQLLQKMGWKPGDGVGKQNTLTPVIEVTTRSGGLGSAETKVTPSDNFQSATKKRMFEKYDTNQNKKSKN